MRTIAQYTLFFILMVAFVVVMSWKQSPTSKVGPDLPFNNIPDSKAEKLLFQKTIGSVT